MTEPDPPPTLRRLGYDTWHDYLQGPEWKHRRRRYIASHRYRECRACGHHHQLAVRHLSYRHPGQEPDHDLCLLCKPCIKTLQQLMRQAQETRDTPPTVRTTVTWMRHQLRDQNLPRKQLTAVPPAYASTPQTGRDHARQAAIKKRRRRLRKPKPEQ